MQQLSWKNFPVKIEKSLCKLFGPKCAPNPVHNSVTIYSVKALSVFLCVKGASPPRRRVTFFCCQKKVTKENHLDLRFKGPLARYGSCRFGGVYSRAGCSGHHCRSKGLCLRSPARRLPRPLAPATVGVFASTGWRLSNRAFAALRRQR